MNGQSEYSKVYKMRARLGERIRHRALLLPQHQVTL